MKLTLAALCTAIGCAACLAEPPANLLAGPEVRGGEGAAVTLVRRGLDGRVAPLDAPPAIAALRLLGLREEVAARVDEVLASRSALMDGLVLGNILLLSEIEPVMRGGSAAERFEVIARGMEALAPARAWGTVRDRVAAVLPGSEADRYLKLISGYESALFDDARARGEVEHAWAFRMERFWKDIGWEIEQAAARVLPDDGDDWLARLVDRLGLTPEQSATIRSIGERFFIESGGRPTRAEEAAFIERVTAELTPRQRLKFLGMALRGELEEHGAMD